MSSRPGVSGAAFSIEAVGIDAARREDIARIACLHRQVFPGFFLSTMGQGFLEELYAGFLDHPDAVLIVARNGTEVVGFAAGTSAPKTFFPALRKRRGAVFLLKALPAILRNPLPVLRKLYAAVFYRGDTPNETAHDTVPGAKPGALLSSIGVAAALQGSGLAERLLLAFESRMASLGSSGIYLTTDAEGNDRVNAFYRKNGYDVDSRFMQSGRRPMFRYVKRIVQGSDDGK